MHRQEAENYLHKKVEDGELISPVLPDGIKNYLIRLKQLVLQYSQAHLMNLLLTCSKV